MPQTARVRRITLHYKGIGQVFYVPEVRRALRMRANSIAAKANVLARAQGVEAADIAVSDGVRPRGRSYARVSSTRLSESEYGASNTERRRILGQAADIPE